MKIYNEPLMLQSAKPREQFNITTRVKAAMEKSGFRDGIILVSALHPDSAVILGDEDPGFLAELEGWLERLGLSDEALKGSPAGSAAARLQGLLLHHQVFIAFSEGRLDLGHGQAVLFIELDGLRPRRIVVKVIGE
jgi:secondary thiamine-phosphate synthase enzyme